jgi:hypothetical protein
MPTEEARHKRSALVAGLALLLTAGCFQPVGPARTFHDYELKAEATAKSVRSSVETALLGTQVATKGDAFPPFVSVLLSEAETRATDAQGTFEGIQPPNAHADRLRTRLSSLLTETTDVLSTLRITARRAELEKLGPEARKLPALSRQLERFAAAHQ